jgi:hypothetical protein
VLLAERRIGQKLIEAQKQGSWRENSAEAMARCLMGNLSHDARGYWPEGGDEYRQIADLDESDVEEVAAEARERGRPVTKADFRRKTGAKRSQPAPVMPPMPCTTRKLVLRREMAVACSLSCNPQW